VALWRGSMPWEYGMGVWIGSVLWECDRESYVAQHTLILINNMSVHSYICTHTLPHTHSHKEWELLLFVNRRCGDPFSDTAAHVAEACRAP